MNQKNIKVQRAPSKSLNYVSKKREAERIDRENQKIMHRIINVKPQMVQTKKMNKEYIKHHLQKRKMIQDRNQGVFLEDMIQNKLRFRDSSNRTSMLPKIAPQTSTSLQAKPHLGERRLMGVSNTLSTGTDERNSIGRSQQYNGNIYEYNA